MEIYDEKYSFEINTRWACMYAYSRPTFRSTAIEVYITYA